MTSGDPNIDLIKFVTEINSNWLLTSSRMVLLVYV